MDPACPFASGLIINNGYITAVLSEEEADDPNLPGPILDLNNQIILPGLIDSHLHLRKFAETKHGINCETPTKEACLDQVKKLTRDIPPGNWILGHGWNHNLWPEGYGSAADLDQAAPEHPVYLTGKSLHVSWANSLALIQAGIGEQTPDPPGGSLQRDSAGKPTGILFEDAVKIIEKIIPSRSVPDTANKISKTQSDLHQMGITGLHDFDRELCLEALFELEKSDQLKLRVQKSIPSDYLDQALERGFQTNQGSNWLWIGGVKDFVDGALGPQTAAMLQPYQKSDDCGMLLLSEDELLEIGKKASAGGLALAVHAIGDLANRTLLNAYSQIREFETEIGIEPLPHRIEHVQLIDPEDAGRLAALKITASMQPIHATSDMEMADTYWGDRTSFAYAPKIQIDSGALVIFGSDAPVEDPNPWLGIHAAVTRQRTNGDPGPEGWHPEGRLSLQQSLEAFTVNPAKASGRATLQGRLASGYWADLIVIDRDPFHSSPDSLSEISVRGTMLDGSWVWRDF
jgi:predicted amidohydrolase YtcJ